MRLIIRVTYTLEQEYGEDYFNELMEEGHTKEEAINIAKDDIYQNCIGRIENRIDNLCLSNWSRNNISMYWRE